MPKNQQVSSLRYTAKHIWAALRNMQFPFVKTSSSKKNLLNKNTNAQLWTTTSNIVDTIKTTSKTNESQRVNWVSMPTTMFVGDDHLKKGQAG